MGVMRILDYFDMYDLKNINMTEIKELGNEENLNNPPLTVLCSRGFWAIFNKKTRPLLLLFTRSFDSSIQKQVVYWKLKKEKLLTNLVLTLN